MWAVEAKNFGKDASYYYMSGCTKEEALRHHAALSNSKEWAQVRSWDKNAEIEEKVS